jgi:manganese-dependent inorganic pyrophosphatase
MDKVFVIGHKKPDTDSVTSAITLSYLKNQLGYDTVPMILGDVNNETKFVLEHFKVKAPKYLNDVKLQIKDLNYNKTHFINQNASVFESFNYMNTNFVSNIPIIDNNQVFLGQVSMKDIAKDMICGDNEYIEASYENIINTIKGEELLRFNDSIVGNILVASYRSTTFIQNIKIDSDTILIVGDRHSIIEYAINSKAKLIILTGSSKIHNEHLKMAEENKVNIIKTELNTFNSAKLISLSKNISTLVQKENIICFDENDEVNDFIAAANRTKYSNFPVIDKDNKCRGLLKLADTADKNKKKVILVDHNEYEQSVDGLDEAEIVEIVDHHKIGTIGTSAPINFRNMPVGSTNTIVYMLYKENNIEIPKHIAGLMMSGIISDTLLFASPTTTEKDKQVVKALASILEIDYEAYGMEMFKAGSTLKNKTEEQIFYTDFKNFDIDGMKIGVSQISTVSSNDITSNSEKYINLLNNISKNNGYHIVTLFVTDILTNGSYIYYNDSSFDILDECFGNDLKQGKYLEGVVSRKKQIIPVIMERIAK